MPTQHAVPTGSVNEYQGKLASKWASTQCTGHVSVTLQLRLVSGRGLLETEISAALWAHEAREALYFFY